MPEIPDRDLERYKAIEKEYKGLEQDWRVAIAQIRWHYWLVGVGVLVLGVALIVVVVVGLLNQGEQTRRAADLSNRIAAAQAAQQRSRFETIRDRCQADNARTAGELVVIRTVAPDLVRLARVALPAQIQNCSKYAANLVRPERVRPPH